MDVGSILIHGSVHQLANTGVQVGIGNTAQRPATAPGFIRYNTDLSAFETYGSAWANIGSVSSVALTGVANAITISGSPVTTSGTFSLSLAGELAGINALATTGIVERTAVGTYATINTLPVANGGTGAITAPAALTALGALPTAGGTMTGTLTLAADPVSAFQAATKEYVDNAAVAATTNAQANSVLKSGSTMTGLLVLSADPAAALGAATKSYVDNSVATAVSSDTYTATAAGGLTLTAKAFSANTTSVTTGLVGGNIAVRSTATTGQTLLSTGTAGAEASWGALNLASANAVTGDLGLANGGTGGTTAATARTSLVVPSFYRTSFTSASLATNLLTVTHALGQQFVHVQVYDNNNNIIQPDNVAMTSTTVSTVDLTSFATITGTWNVVVVG